MSTHELNGTKAKYVEATSEVAAGRPKFPKNISPDARKVFKRLCQLLEQRRVLTAGDSELLRLYSVAFTRHERALEKLALEGEVCPYTRLDSNGQPHTFYKESLWLKIATDAEKFQRACLSDLGLNPLQRAKVKPAQQPKPPAEEMPTREETTLPEDDINLNSIDETLIN